MSQICPIEDREDDGRIRNRKISMKKLSPEKSRRRKPPQPSDVLEWHGLYDDRSLYYVNMLKQDALEPWEAACALYPRPPEEYDMARVGDDGRMQSLHEKIDIGIKTRKLETFTFSEKKLIPTDQFLQWARKRGLIGDKLNGRMKIIRRSTKNYSGSEIHSLRADNEILRAVISVWACEEYKRSEKNIRGGQIAKVLERYGEILFKAGEPPKSSDTTARLLNQCLKKLQKQFENKNDYKGIRE